MAISSTRPRRRRRIGMAIEEAACVMREELDLIKGSYLNFAIPVLAGTRLSCDSAYECRELSDILYVVDKKGRFTAQPMARAARRAPPRGGFRRIDPASARDVAPGDEQIGQPE